MNGDTWNERGTSNRFSARALELRHCVIHRWIETTETDNAETKERKEEREKYLVGESEKECVCLTEGMLGWLAALPFRTPRLKKSCGFELDLSHNTTRHSAIYPPTSLRCIPSAAIHDNPTSVAQSPRHLPTMASSSASVPAAASPAEAHNLEALQDKLYDESARLTLEDPNVVFHQNDIVDMSSMAGIPLTTVLQLINSLLNAKLYKVVQDADGICWRTRTVEEAKRYASMTPAFGNY